MSSSFSVAAMPFMIALSRLPALNSVSCFAGTPDAAPAGSGWPGCRANRRPCGRRCRRWSPWPGPCQIGLGDGAHLRQPGPAPPRRGEAEQQAADSKRAGRAAGFMGGGDFWCKTRRFYNACFGRLAWPNKTSRHPVPDRPGADLPTRISGRSAWTHTARFLTTASQLDQLPPTELPEIAFVGRSNAGKSTAINTLTQQKRLAFASKTPGARSTSTCSSSARAMRPDALLGRPAGLRLCGGRARRQAALAEGDGRLPGGAPQPVAAWC